MKVKVNLKSAQDVKDFVAVAYAAPFDITCGEGRYIVDGKSLMGLFSLNLEKPVVLSIDNEAAAKNPEEEKAFINAIEKWKVA